MLKVIPFEGAEPLLAHLELKEPPFYRTDPFRQFRYLARYVHRMQCKSVVVERNYIDRDFIEDFSLFHSRSLSSSRNYCTRLHFLSTSAEQTEAALGNVNSDDYLGFTVIRPLDGAPIGRTVLRPYPPHGISREDGVEFTRLFPAYACTTHVHLAGQEIASCGLAFQQQDTGVSACATTALWSALHLYRQGESIGRPTPAHITALATGAERTWTPTLASNEEGLSLEEMRRALRAVGMTSTLLETNTASEAVSLVQASLLSGFAPVLIMEQVGAVKTWHAVTVSGVSHPAAEQAIGEFDVVEKGLNIRRIYLHDDRVGPYVKFRLEAANSELRVSPEEGSEVWAVRFVMIPLSPKIRLAPTSLRDIGIQVTRVIQQELRVGASWAYRFVLGTTYARQVPALARQLTSSLPRYLGVVSFECAGQEFDILLDSTSTQKNLAALGLLERKGDARTCALLAAKMRIKYLTA